MWRRFTADAVEVVFLDCLHWDDCMGSVHREVVLFSCVLQCLKRASPFCSDRTMSFFCMGLLLREFLRVCVLPFCFLLSSGVYTQSEERIFRRDSIALHLLVTKINDYFTVAHKRPLAMETDE